MDEIDEAIHRLLLKGDLVQVDVHDPETGGYKIWTPEQAKAANLRIIPYEPPMN